MNTTCVLAVSIVISILFLAITATITLYVYEVTKASYLQVGQNDGEIQAKYDIHTRLSSVICSDSVCGKLNEGDESVTILTVKTAAIYAIKHKDKLIGFCVYD